jgi:hypothetical protein
MQQRPILPHARSAALALTAGGGDEVGRVDALQPQRHLLLNLQVVGVLQRALGQRLALQLERLRRWPICGG